MWAYQQRTFAGTPKNACIRFGDIVDLNLTLIQAYLKEVESSLYEESKHMDCLDLCRSMSIVDTLPEYTKPKNVGGPVYLGGRSADLSGI